MGVAEGAAAIHRGWNLRYFRLYLYFLRFSFSRAMEFRVDFFFRFIMDCVFYAVNLGFYTILFQHTQALGGWSLQQCYVFVSTIFLVDALNMTITASNIWALPFFINQGNLDYYLVRPVSSLFFLSLREFSANSFMNLLVAVGVWVWSIANSGVDYSALQILIHSILILNGAFLFFLVQMLSVLPVFWTHAPHGYHDVFWGLQQFAERPHKIFQGGLRIVLITVLPFSLMASVPAQVLIEGLDWKWILYCVLMSGGFFTFIGWLWNVGLRNYSSASS